jgi:hypothetical protein
MTTSAKWSRVRSDFSNPASPDSSRYPQLRTWPVIWNEDGHTHRLPAPRPWHCNSRPRGGADR